MIYKYHVPYRVVTVPNGNCKPRRHQEMELTDTQIIM